MISNAHIVDTLGKVLAGYSLVMGTSAYSRTLSWPMLDPREYDLKSAAETVSIPVTLVSGRGRVGLANEELQRCRYHIAITADPECSLLNLVMAVRAIACGVCTAWLATQENGEQVEREETPYSLADNPERLYSHLEQTLPTTGFIRENYSEQVMDKLRRLFTRACPKSQELSILRRILAPIEQRNEDNKAE